MRSFYILLLFAFIATQGFSQLSPRGLKISGPTNVVPNSQTHYELISPANPTGNCKWLVLGGTVINKNVVPGSPIFCNVLWDQNVSTGNITLIANGISSTMDISISELNSNCPQANAGPDVTICPGGFAILGTPSVAGYSYSWLPTTGLNDPNIAQPICSPTSGMNYTLIMTGQDNLLINSDFEAGISGFASDYGIFPNGVGCSNGGVFGSIAVVTDPYNLGTQYANVTDHSSNGDKMLFVDASCTANLRVWSQTVTVTPNTTYYFSGYGCAASWRPGYYGLTDAAHIKVKINGVDIISDDWQNFSAYYQWMEFKNSWNSGSATLATIEIYDNNVNADLNDFCLDDLFFGTCPRTTDQVNVFINSNAIPTITPAGPIDYYTETDNTPAGFTLTSSQTTGNQWYKDGQLIPGATNQSLFTGYVYNTGNSYYVKVNGCQSNAVSVTYHNFGYGFFGEEQPYFGAVTFPFQSPQYYCKNTTNNFIRNFNLGTGATYTWNFSPWGNISYSSLTPGTYNPSSYTASIDIGNNPNAWDRTYIQGIADLNGHQKIVDYNLIITSQTPVENRSFCGSQQYQIINQTGNNFTDRKAGESGFDWEHYEFGPNCTIISPLNLAGSGPRSFTIPGKTPLSQPLKVQFSGPSYIRTYCYYNWGGCYRKEINVSLAACRSSEIVNNEVSIYPNPATSQIRITSKHNITQVEIYHSFSPFINKMIKTNKTNTISINIGDLKAGIYICKILTVNGTEYQKLLIEK